LKKFFDPAVFKLNCQNKCRDKELNVTITVVSCFAGVFLHFNNNTNRYFIKRL